MDSTTTTIENNKRKASDEMSNEMTRKQRKILNPLFADLDDPVFAVSVAVLRKLLANWFDACDPWLLEQGFGTGLTPNVAKDYVESVHIQTCIDYYRDKSAVLLEADKALCDGLCDLNIFHIIAREWTARPTSHFGSYEIQVLLFVLKHAIIRKNLDREAAGRVLVRLLDLSYAYSDAYQVLCEREKQMTREGETMEEEKKPVDEPRMPKIPIAQQATVAIFFFPNLQFLYRPLDDVDGPYALACDNNIKQGVESFTESLAQLDDNLIRYDNSFVWSHKTAAENAFTYAIANCNMALSFRFRPLILNDKPLSIKQEMAYVASY